MRFALGLVARGIALEFLQRWTGYRSFEDADMAAEGAGVLADLTCAQPFAELYARLFLL